MDIWRRPFRSKSVLHLFCFSTFVFFFGCTERLISYPAVQSPNTTNALTHVGKLDDKSTFMMYKWLSSWYCSHQINPAMFFKVLDSSSKLDRSLILNSDYVCTILSAWYFYKELSYALKTSRCPVGLKDGSVLNNPGK